MHGTTLEQVLAGISSYSEASFTQQPYSKIG